MQLSVFGIVLSLLGCFAAAYAAYMIEQTIKERRRRAAAVPDWVRRALPTPKERVEFFIERLKGRFL